MTTLGRSDLEIFPLVLGANTFGWTTDERESHRVLDAFVDGGGNLLDTADSYSAWVDGHEGGESERVIGSWIARTGRRDDILIGTKVSQHPAYKGLSAANVAKAADASLQRLGVDHIDVYYAHADDPQTPLIETVAAFDELVRAGKVRHVAVSNYSAVRIREWMEIATAEGLALPVALQPHYNLVTRRPFEGELQQVAADHDLGVVPYFALASGFLTGKFRTVEDIRGTTRAGITERFYSAAGLKVVDVLEDIANLHSTTLATVALAWLRGRPTITAPIASARTPEQLQELMAVATLTLTSDDRDQLDAVSSASELA